MRTRTEIQQDQDAISRELVTLEQREIHEIETYDYRAYRLQQITPASCRTGQNRVRRKAREKREKLMARWHELRAEMERVAGDG